MRTPQIIAFDRLPQEALLGGTWRRGAFRSDHALVTVNWMDPAMPRLAEHRHPFDQISLVTEGTMTFTVDGTEFDLEAGEALLIPRNVPHTAWATGSAIALNIDVYAPPREDYLFLTDHQTFDEPEPTASEILAVHDLVHTWAAHLDSGTPVTIATLLTPDGVVEGLGPDPLTASGLLEWATERASRPRRTRHHISNIRVTRRTDSRYSVSSYVTLFALSGDEHTPSVEFVGSYDDELVDTPAGLRFERRMIKAFL